MKRLVEFSDRHQRTLELAYYPPYHSKYNPIERCWGILENHWNGTLLTPIDTVLTWGENDDLACRGTHRASARPRLRNGRPPHTPRIPTHCCPAQTIRPPAEMEPLDRTSNRVAHFRRQACSGQLNVAAYFPGPRPQGHETFRDSSCFVVAILGSKPARRTLAIGACYLPRPLCIPPLSPHSAMRKMAKISERVLAIFG